MFNLKKVKFKPTVSAALISSLCDSYFEQMLSKLLRVKKAGAVKPPCVFLLD